MANIIVNTVCNLQCPYCFADDCKTCNKDQNITVDMFKREVNFIAQTSNYVGVLGGEPTIHPNIDKLLIHILSNDKIEFCTIFSNGIEIDRISDFFESRKIQTLINLNDKSITTIENFDKIMSNIELIEKMNSEDNLSLGLNVYDENQDFSDILYALKTFNKRTLRLSVTVPNNKDKKEMNSILYFMKMKDAIMRLLDELYKIEVVPHSDCNYIPKCIFTDKEIDTINKMFSPLEEKCQSKCNITYFEKCSPVLDFYPDGTVARCFGFSEYDRQPFYKYKDIMDIEGYFNRSIDNVASIIPNNNECKDCYQFLSNICTSGCLSYKQNKINELKRRINWEEE